VDGPRHALQQLGAGRVGAAVVPRWLLGPAGPVGRPVEIDVRPPLDPVVLVVGPRARCVGQGGADEAARRALETAFGPVPKDLADAPPAPADLVLAWAAQRRARPALPPLELLVTPPLARRIWGAPPSPPAPMLPARLEVDETPVVQPEAD
jgi:hypothetical protein